MSAVRMGVPMGVGWLWGQKFRPHGSPAVCLSSPLSLLHSWLIGERRYALEITQADRPTC